MWNVYFDDGDAGNNGRSSLNNIRLVRGGEGNEEFIREYANRVEQANNQTNDNQQRQSTNACNAFYQGKSIGFKPAGFSYLGSVLDAVVLGKGNGNVSLKIVDRNFTDLYGKTLELSCTSDQLQ